MKFKFSAGGFLLLLLFLVLLIPSSSRASKKKPSVQIISPSDGSTFDANDPNGLKFHVKIQGFDIPAEGYGDIYLDGQLLGSTPQSEVVYMIDGSNTLHNGEHRASVILFDNKDQPIGIEKYSKFVIKGSKVKNDAQDGNPIPASTADERNERDDLIDMEEADREADIAPAAPEPPIEWSKSCKIDAGQTRITGPGLKRAAAGIMNEFVIEPRDASGRRISPEACTAPLDLTVVIVPAPLDHSLARDADADGRPTGLYTCRWMAEYAGSVKIEIKVMSSGRHAGGSPFPVEVTQMWSVTVVGAIAPDPAPYGGRILHSSREARHHVPEVAAGAPLVPGGDDAGVRAACGAAAEGGGARMGKDVAVGGCAYVTMVSSDSYLTGALTLMYSIRKTGSTLPFVAMVTADGAVSPATRTALRRAGAAVHEVRRMRKADIRDMSEERWNDNYTKLRLWQLPFRKLVFIDSDMIVLQPLDHLFALDAALAAVPDAFHPCYLNTGFMLLRPDQGTFRAMAALIDEVSSEESEQTLVNHYFLDRWHVLHYTYNFAKHNVMSPTRFQIYVERYMDTVKAVHYLGVKPWMCSRDRDCMRHVPYYGGPSNMYLYDLWWTMFEQLCDEPSVRCTIRADGSHAPG